MPTSHCMGFCAGHVVPAEAATNSGAARCSRKGADHATAQPTGVTVVEEPPEALPGARADLKVEVKARKWLIDVAIVCPATKSVVARQNTHLHTGVSAKAGEAVKRKKYKGAVQGFVVEAGGRLGPAARKFLDEVVAECEMSEAARKAAASKIMRAIGICRDRSHAQAGLYMMATLVQELRNEEQFMADFAHGVV